MTDTPSFRDTVEEVTQEAEKPVETEAKVETETPKEEQQVEKFAEDKDLSGLTPEQLLETKKQWEAAYTKKRQAEKAELKQLQERLKELETKQVSTPAPDFNAQRDEAAQLLRNGQLSVDQYVEQMRNLAIEEAKIAARDEYKVIKSEEQQVEEESNQQSLYESFVSSDPRLSEDNPNFNKPLFIDIKSKLGDALDEYLEQHGTSKGFDAVSMTKQLVEEYDRQIDELVKQRTQESIQAAKMRDAKTLKSTARGTSTQSTSVSGSSFRDVLSQTMDELG